jgi:hypothetical protein
MAPLLTRLDEQLATCADPQRRAELVAERGCYLARVGDFEAARAATELARANDGGGANPRISAWVMLLEGLVIHFERDGRSARDRVSRAHALSIAARQHSLAALTAAWLAQIRHDDGDHFPAADLIKLAIDLAGPEDRSAHIRVGLFMGDAHSALGDKDPARHWYEAARMQASRIGDEAALGAIMARRSTLQLNRMQTLAMLDDGYTVPAADLDFASLELESACHYQAATGMTSMDFELQVGRARALILGGRFDAAQALLQALLDGAELAHGCRSRPRLAADLAWCRSRQGESAPGLPGDDVPDAFDAMDADDRLVCARRWQDILSAQGQLDSAQRWTQRAADAAARLLEQQAALRRALDAIAGHCASRSYPPSH